MNRARKGWRPALAFVLAGALAGELALSLAALAAFRYLGPALGFRDAAVLLGALLLAATVFLGWLLARLLLAPIQALEAYAVAAARGAREPVVEPAHFGTRETEATALRVIEMAEALRDREATIRAFTDHVTHELKTPVAALRAAAELLADGGGLSAQDARLAGDIDAAARGMEARLAALREAARAREARYFGRCRLGEAAGALRAAWPALEVRAAPEDFELPLSQAGLEIILSHLARNALEHGARTLLLQAGEGEDGPVLEARDDGAGVAPEMAEQIFEPFFTTRREVGGTGMGLTILRNLLAAQGGAVVCAPASRGACFRMRFRRDFPAVG